jgi:hypothetical protein
MIEIFNHLSKRKPTMEKIHSGADYNRLFTVSPFAGIIQSRFNGYYLSRMAPQT